MAKHRNRSATSVFADINITPLTDIFLVLLIIFMVTTAVTVESAAHVDLPKAEASAPASGQAKSVVVTCTADHQIKVNSQSVTIAELEGTLRSALSQTSDKSVIFRGDAKVILGEMVDVLDIAKSAGAASISIAVAQLPPGGAADNGAPPGGM